MTLALCREGMAADKEGTFIILYPGGRECINFLDDYAKSEAALGIGWIFGYLTAINKTRYGKDNYFSDLEWEDIPAWIASWCRDNPTKDLYDATNALALRHEPRYMFEGEELMFDPDTAKKPISIPIEDTTPITN